ncbi:MAG TPA: FAD-dependent oxidoreductase [Pseudonocardiaceae bacterium]|nr:FAD-dependent oxidoreductase [Pseudonocardiaceae bacterium]
MNETFDVVVVGGGPAGSTAATVVAKRGHRVLLLEKQRFPRYQIGESLLPSTVHGVCRLLGVADEVAAAGFTLKRGGTFRWGSGREPWQFSFAMSPRLPEPTSTAFQVERARFDDILLRNAARHGVDVRQDCDVRDVVTDENRIGGVEYITADGVRRTVSARYVVDASGNNSRLHGATGGARVYSDFFRNLAVFGYFAGGRRLPQPNSGNIFCAAFDAGWLWYIPLREDLTSVGAVISPEYWSAVARDPRATWRELIDACPEVRDLLTGVPTATQAPYDQVRVRKDYSYWTTKFCSPGLVLVGDAACFVDPVLSSGVHLATYGAILAARSINACLAGALPEARAFAEFENRYRREFGQFYEFLVSFYDMQRDEQSYFWSAKQVTGLEETESAAFAALVGGLISGDEAVGARLSGAADDLRGAVDRLATADDRRNPLYSSRIVGETFREGRNLAEEAMFGAPLDDDAGTAPGGVVLAADGLGWTTS